MIAVRTFCREFETTPVQDELLLVLEDAYQGSSEGVGVNPIDEDDEESDDDGGALSRQRGGRRCPTRRRSARRSRPAGT